MLPYSDGRGDDPSLRQRSIKILEPLQISKVVAFPSGGAADAINGSVVMADDGWAEFKQSLVADSRQPIADD